MAEEENINAQQNILQFITGCTNTIIQKVFELYVIIAISALARTIFAHTIQRDQDY
jgi:hypothetical protein